MEHCLHIFRFVLCVFVSYGLSLTASAAQNDPEATLDLQTQHAAHEIARMEMCLEAWNYRLDHYGDGSYKSRSDMRMTRFILSDQKSGYLEVKLRVESVYYGLTPSSEICGHYDKIGDYYVSGQNGTFDEDFRCVINNECISVGKKDMVREDFRVWIGQMAQSMYYYAKQFPIESQEKKGESAYQQSLLIREIIQTAITPNVSAPTFGPSNANDNSWIIMFGKDSKVAWEIRKKVVQDMALIDKEYFPLQ